MLDLGEVSIGKAALYQVRVTTSVPNCGPQDAVSVDVVTREGGFDWGETLGHVNCGTAFLVSGFEPGRYWLEMSSLATRDTRARASVPFDVVDKNLDLPVVLSRGIDIMGKVIPADDTTKLTLDGVRIGLRPVGRAFETDGLPTSPDRKGFFRFANVACREHEVMVLGLSKSYYVRGIVFGTLRRPTGL